MQTFLQCSIEGGRPCLWMDATCLKVGEAGRIVSVTAMIAIGANTDDRREVLGMHEGGSEAEPLWADFLCALRRRGLRGVKLVISDAREGLKAAVCKVISATWPRCRVSFMPNVRVHAPADRCRAVSALAATIVAQTAERAARDQWRVVAGRRRERFPRIVKRMDEAEDDVLAHMRFPKEHRARMHRANPLERLNGERTRQRRSMTPETVAKVGDKSNARLPAAAAWHVRLPNRSQ